MRTRVTVFCLIVIVSAVFCGFALSYVTPAPFSIRVITRPTVPLGQQANIQALSGQKCVFLVVFAEKEGWLHGRQGYGTAVKISVIEPTLTAQVTLSSSEVAPGEVAEVTVIPDPASVNQTLDVEIVGERRGLTQNNTVTIEVVTGTDTLGFQATEIRDKFVPWLASNHPELGILNETDWSGTIVNPRILVVMHYIFFSEDWELYVTWHVTIPPHDWTRIYLRKRFTEVNPSNAFEISSVTLGDEPHAIEVPDWV